MADCDAQLVGHVDAPSSERASQTIPPRIRRAVLRRHHNRCAAQILVSMGFRQREARQMLDASGPHVGDGVGVEAALRTVLRQAKVSCMAERVEGYGGMGAWSGLGESAYWSAAARPARPYC
jgi:hypothetical protein